MNFILFHKGKNFPKHVSFCINQIKKTNPNCSIYFITDNSGCVDDDKIKIINTSELAVPDIGNYYINDVFSDLWRNAALRLFYIEAVIEKYNLENIIHFDNDVLIYEELSTLKSVFERFNICITSHFEGQFVFGFSFIKNNNSLKLVNQHMLELLRLGEKELVKIIPDCMPHEMRLLGYINSKLNLIEPLPIFPGSKNYSAFNMCFDPSSYGQFIGGRAPEANHIIGKEIIDKKIQIGFNINDKKPRGIYNSTPFNICNLHIHSKQLEKFI